MLARRDWLPAGCRRQAQAQDRSDAVNASADGQMVVLPRTLKELASELDLTHEALYRTLSDMGANRKVEQGSYQRWAAHHRSDRGARAHPQGTGRGHLRPFQRRLFNQNGYRSVLCCLKPYQK